MYNAGLETIIAMPQGREDLAFTYAKPADWRAIETVKITDPEAFQPLAIIVGGYGGAVFSVSVRAGFGIGTLREWLEWLGTQGVREVSIGGVRGYISETNETAGVTEVVTRSFLFEDGGRLFSIATLAAAPFFDEVRFVLAEMIESFRLLRPQGSLVGLAPFECALAS